MNQLKRIYLFIWVMMLFTLSACSQSVDNQYIEESDYDLIWSDEFEYEGKPDSSKWHHQTIFPNGNSWFNGEQQTYTDRIENSYVEGGNLYMVARKEEFKQQGITKQYTSVRLNSKFAFTYGRLEVRAKLAMGEGVWPAIWTLGQNITEKGGYWAEEYGTKGWPACGEIDIMEHWGDNPQIIQCALHNPASFGGTVNKKAIKGEDVGNSFHVYAMEWSKNKIDFFYDDSLYYTYQPEIKNKKTWPYDAPQYLLLNIAMGGTNRTIDPNFKKSAMIIDYVRIYQKNK